MFRIIVEKGQPKGAAFTLAEGANTVGRSHEAQVRLAAQDISGRHLRLTVAGNMLEAENLSQFGTQVDGRKIEGKTPLKAGQRLALGRDTILRIEEMADLAGGGDEGSEVTMAQTMVEHTRMTGTSGARPPAPPIRPATAAPTPSPAPSTVAPKTPVGAPDDEGEENGELADRMTGAGGPLSAPAGQPPTAAPKTGASAQKTTPPPTRAPAPDIRPGPVAPPDEVTGIHGGLTRGAPTTRGGLDSASELAAAPAARPTGIGGGAPMPSAEEHELTENATRAMMTRVASPEEIEYLKQAEGQKTRRRIVLTVGLIVPLLIILAILLPKPKPPETVLEWPRDAKGEFLDAFEPAPSGGVKDGGYAILYPGNPGAKVTQVPGGVIIETRIGRKLNVPLRVILKEDENPHYVELTRDQMVAEWKDEVSREEGRWSIGLPYATVYFIGGENGIPYKRVAYQRDDGQQWFGLASILRTGKKRIVLRAEVPVGEEARAENLLWDINLDPATAFERAAWEGGPAAARVDAPAVLRDVRVELDRMAPATWSSIEALLVSVLAQSVREGKTEQEQEAVALLARLRERQALWFNAQRIAREDALAQGDQARAQRIADLCKAVFSNIEDQRYYSVRKW